MCNFSFVAQFLFPALIFSAFAVRGGEGGCAS